MLIVTGTLRVALSDLPGFLSDLASLAETTRRREGNLLYHTAVLDGGAGRLVVLEWWRDQAALTAHLRAADTAAFVERWQGRLEGDVRVYDACNERPLAAE